MSHKAADRIRNVALIGHRGCGKTSLAEAMLFEAGVINRLGSAERRHHGLRLRARRAGARDVDRRLDLLVRARRAQAQRDRHARGRRASSPRRSARSRSSTRRSSSSAASPASRSTPSGSGGAPTRLGLPRLVFVNMLDRERADFFAALASLQSAFGSHVVATEIPIGSEHEVSGVIDLIDMRAFAPRGRRARGEVEAEIPDELAGLAAEYREKLMDEVAENSDALMERYLEGVEISHEETVTALKKGVTEGHLFPVTCGIATRNLGTGRLLEALVEDLPFAGDARPAPAPRRRRGGGRDRARRGRPS